MKAFNKLILASLLMIPGLTFAQNDNSKHIKTGTAAAVSVASGVASYKISKKLHKPENGKFGSYLQKRDKNLHFSYNPKKLSEAQIQEIKSMLKEGDQVLITHAEDIPTMYGIQKNRKKIGLYTTSPDAVASTIRQIQSTEHGYVKSISKMATKARNKILKKVNIAGNTLAVLSLSSAGYAIYSWNSGSNKKAAARFNGSRSVVEKSDGSSRSVAGGKTVKASRQ